MLVIKSQVTVISSHQAYQSGTFSILVLIKNQKREALSLSHTHTHTFQSRSSNKAVFNITGVCTCLCPKMSNKVTSSLDSPAPSLEVMRQST